MRYFIFIILIFLIVTVLANGQSSSMAVNGRGLSFVPDFTFKGSVLSGWQSFGEAVWKANNGKLTCNVQPGATGLLMLNQSLEDVGINTMFNCSAGSEAGLLFRIQKTQSEISGLMVSVKEGEIASYRISFDLQGKELSRQKLRSAGSIIRMAPPPSPAALTHASDTARPVNRVNRVAGPSDIPLQRPVTSYRTDEWNQIEVFLDLNIIRSFLNDGGETAGGATDDAVSYGPIAIYAGGKGEVSFKDFSFKDLGMKYTPTEKSSPRFMVQRISDMYYSWSAAAADFNRDGIMDIVAGPYIYYGPEYIHYREIYPGSPSNPGREFTETNCQYTYDFNGDGWPDVLTGPPHPTLYINPKGASRRWDKFEVVPAAQTEITLFADIDGDGKPELIYGANGSIQFAKPNPADATKPFIVHTVSGKGYSMAHGLGVGDINGDGHTDIINPNGWWENPSSGDSSKSWIYHPEAFARYGHRSVGVGGSTMAVYDVNGDGLNDVVTALNAHGFGLAWFEQTRDASKKISFVCHMISDDFSSKNAGDVTFSELHGSAVADVDGDGIPDFIVGKRYWSHLDDYFDPDPYGPPVLYWYKTVRNKKAPGGAEFIPELIHNRSGAGSDILAADLNKDGKIDIVSSTDRGTFIFWNKGTVINKRPKKITVNKN